MWSRFFDRLEREVLELIRLLLLVAVTVGVAVSGYVLFDYYLMATFLSMITALSDWWEALSIAGLWRNAVTWFMAMGRNWLLVEIPKRLAILYLVPTVVLMLLPGPWISAAKRWLRRRKEEVLRIKDWFMSHAERWFGKWAGTAIAVVFALFFFILFYSFFSVYMALWFGFIKLPSSVVWIFTLAWGKSVYFAQKFGFRKWAFKLTGWLGRQLRRWLMPMIARVLPDFHWFRWIGRNFGFGRQLTEKEQLQKKREHVRWAIRRRYRNAEWAARRREQLSRPRLFRGHRSHE